MPLRSSARKIPGSDAYMVDYPLKPGDSLIELTYSLPYESGEPYFGQLLYSNLETISFWNIKNEIELLEERGYSTKQMETKFQRSLAFPFFLLAMTLLLSLIHI